MPASRRPRLPHARRVGPAPWYLAQLATPRVLVAREVRAGAVGVRRDGRALAPHEEVHVNVLDREMGEDVEVPSRLAGSKRCSPRSGQGVRIVFHLNPTNDAWCRDHGPSFIQRDRSGGREEAIVDWGYNAWGGKYPPYDADDVDAVADRGRVRDSGVSSRAS